MTEAISQGTPDAGGSTPPAPGSQTQTTPPATPPAAPEFDPSKLTPDQLNKVLENQELWKNPRLAGLLDADKKLKQLEKDRETQTETQLTEQKKFEELAQKRGDDLAKALQRNQDLQVNQALTNLLVKENPVDLDGALQLIDKSKITVDDSGNVTGVEDALKTLKEGKPYLFGTGTPGQPNVGTPSNPTTPGQGSGTFKFKESQLTPEFYAAHKDEIDEAGRLGLIEPDGSPR